MELVERAARNVCLKVGEDPDERVQSPATDYTVRRWQLRVPEVEAVMETISDACASAEAARQVSPPTPDCPEGKWCHAYQAKAGEWHCDACDRYPD